VRKKVRGELIIWLAVLTAGVLLLVWPVNYYRIFSEGTDSYKTHHVLYGDRRQEQTVEVKEKISGVGAILVDMRRSFDLPPVEVFIYGEDGGELARQTISPADIKDDDFAWTLLSKAVGKKGEKIRIEFGAPEAGRDNMVGLRFDEETKQLAMGVVEEVPRWKRIGLWAGDNPEAAARTKRIIWGGLIMAAILSLATIETKKAAQQGEPRLVRRVKYNPWLWLLVALAVFALTIRIPTALKVESAFGGDVFNYLHQSRAWLEGENPFAEEFRRKAPLLPLLLIPGLMDFIDPLMWGRIISMVGAVVAVVIVPLLLVRFSVPRPLALGAGLLLAVNRGFWWESVHGLANTLYAVLIIVAIYTLVSGVSKRGRYMTGVLSGLAYLTRWEGFLVGVVLLPAVWLKQRLRIRTIFYTLWPALVLMAIPFVMWPVTGEIGMRTAADVAGDSGLGLATSIDDFVNNWKKFKLFFGRSWLLTENVGDQFVYFLAGMLVGMGVEFLRKRKSRLLGWLVKFAPYLIAVLIVGAVAQHSLEAQKFLVLLLALLLGVGAGGLLWRWPKHAIPIYIVLAVQIVVVTVILPKPRYYLQLIPMMSVGIMFALGILNDGARSWISRAGTLVAAGVIIMFVYTDSSLAMPGMISDYNEKSHSQTVALRAAQYLRPLEGKVGIVEESDMPLRVYLSDRRTKIFPIEFAADIDNFTDEEMRQWLDNEGVTYIVETTFQPVFSITDRQPELFERVEEVGTKYADTKAVIYRYLREE
jgi:hypothetical protein